MGLSISTCVLISIKQRLQVKLKAVLMGISFFLSYFIL